MASKWTRYSALLVGLWLYGFSMALMVKSSLGLNPWDVFHQGVAERSGLSLGAVVAVTGAIVLLLWIPLRQRPGLGTLANVVVIAVSVDVSLLLLGAVLPGSPPLLAQVALLGVGITLNALATVLYIGAGMGAGPRDGLMTGVVARTGQSVRLVRSSIEVAVIVAGWLLGGTVGVGTLAYAFGVGPLIQWFARMPVLGTAALGGRRTARSHSLDDTGTLHRT